MSGPLSGPGLGLQLPQNLYPSELYGAPIDTPSNSVCLNAGDSLPVPRGDWLIDFGMYGMLQYLNPITNTWSNGPDAAWTGGIHLVSSDGFSVRVTNLLGCPLSAVVVAAGSGYAQATTTITPTPGNSTWLPVVGGALALTGGTINTGTAGAGYGVAPIVLFPAPPNAANNPNGVGGTPASGYVGISSGTVSGFTFTNPGSGYPTAPTVVVVPNPTDPNITTGITNATLTFSLTAAGALTGALCTNPGAPIANPNLFTLTVTGAGSAGSLTGNVLQTVTSATVTGAAGGYGTVAALLTSVGGVPVQGGIVSPFSLNLAWRPRPAQIGLIVTGAGSLGPQNGSIYDGGLFLTSAAPTPVIVTNPLASTGTVNTGGAAFTMGNRPIVVTMQPLR